MTHASTTLRLALRQTCIPVAIAAFTTAFIVAVFAAGYQKGFADALHDDYFRPALIIRPSNRATIPASPAIQQMTTDR